MSDLSREKVAKALLHPLKAAGVKWMRYVFVDISNQIRSKALNIANKEVEENPEVVLDGTKTSHNTNLFTCYANAPGSSSRCCGVNMVPNLETLHILPYSPTHAALYCTNVSAGEQAADLSTRAFLEKQVLLARSAGICFAVGVEIEFFLLKNGKPINTRNWGDDAELSDTADFINQVVDMLSAQNNVCSSIEISHVECGKGQYELVVRYRWNPLLIADSIITIRQTVHAVAKQQGYRATFLPKPFADMLGSGMHLHLSFSDIEGGENKLAGDNEYGLSDIGSNMIMGVVKHLPAMLAITLPTCNSYSRMKKGLLSGYKQNWGVESREAGVRVCRDVPSNICSNIELRMCDATANPYLAIGALIAAALDGIKNKYALCVPDEGEELPNNLADNLENLKQSQFFKDVMGSKLFDRFVDIKEKESQHPVKDIDVY